MSNPKVSIVIPVYNAEEYIEKCLDSIFNQTYREIELIFVDDKSTDNSKDVLLNKLKVCPFEFVLVENKSNCGPSITRNNGTKKASGKYITYIDSDDFVNKTYIEYLVKTAESGLYDLVVSEIVELSNYSNADLSVADFVSENFEYGIKADVLRKHGYACGFLYNKQYICDNNVSFIGDYMEDVIFNIKYLLNVKKIGISKSSLYFYYKRSGTLSRPANREKVALKTLMCACEFDRQYLSYNDISKFAELLQDRRYVRNCYFGELKLVGFDKHKKFLKNANHINNGSGLRKMILSSSLTVKEKITELIMSFGFIEKLIYQLLMR